MRLLLRLAALVAALVAIVVWVRLPSPPLTVPLPEKESLRRRTEWRGAYHIHSDRSDGTGSVDAIARAASAAGLDFIIVTDHGDATRTPEPPAYRAAVLVIDAVEISTTDGHFVALGLDAPAPFRLGGRGADVVDDVHWLGGFGLAAHPDSPRRSLSWRDRAASVDGLEWFNADTQWRDEPRWSLGLRLLGYPFRSAGTIASLFDRPADPLAWWDAAAAEGRHLITLAALDAHARLGMRGTDDEEGLGGFAFEVPSYREMFGIASNRVWLSAAPNGNAAHDATLVLDAVRAGHSYSVIEPFARPGFLRATVAGGGRLVHFGDRMLPGERLDLRVEIDGPAGADIRLLHNGRVIAHSGAPVLSFGAVTTPGNYRVEVHVPASRDRRVGMPWMVTNGLFVGSESTPQVADVSSPTTAVDLASCRPEADVDSLATWTPQADGAFEFRYALARGVSPFAAIACTLPAGGRAGGRVRLEGSAVPTMRVLTQWRAPSADRDLRWGGSVRLDANSRMVQVDRERLAPVGREAASASLESADTLLLVIDRRHAKPGAEGRVRLDRIEIERSGTR